MVMCPIKVSSTPEPTGVPNANEMIQQLTNDQETVVRTARSIFPIAAWSQ